MSPHPCQGICREGVPSGEGKGRGGRESEEESPRGVLEIRSHGSSNNSFCSCSITASPERPLSQDGCRRKNQHLSTGWKKLVGDVLGKKSAGLASSVSFHGKGAGARVKDANKSLARMVSADDERNDIGEFKGTRSWRSFDYAELAAATDDFSPDNLIGRGGHALVYKGRLKDGLAVAVKWLKKKDDDDDQQDRTGTFLSELGIVVHVDHPNTVRLIGFSTDGGLFFIIELCPRGSLASLLHGSAAEGVLEWKVRFKVAVRVAQGLQYLHHHCRRRVIHRDIKPSNILLGEDYEPQISDFGLAKWLPEKWIHHVVSPVEGTIGYLAPEYFMHGIVDEKTDVFAFGIVLLEIITGRRAVDSSGRSLVMWAQPLLEEGNIEGLADPRLGEEYDIREMRHAVLTASMCTHHISTSRPDMNQVVKMLTSQDDSAKEWKHESVSRAAFILSACDSGEGYDPTDYLLDLNRHMQLLMES